MSITQNQIRTSYVVLATVSDTEPVIYNQQGEPLFNLGDSYYNSTTYLIHTVIQDTDEGPMHWGAGETPVDYRLYCDLGTNTFYGCSNGELFARVGSGDITNPLSANLDANDHFIRNLPDAENLGDAVNKKLLDTKANITDVILSSEKGTPNGVATLDANGKVTSTQLALPIASTTTAGITKPDGITLNTSIDGTMSVVDTSFYKPNLLEFKWSDHLFNSISWLRGDTFSWQSGDVYTAAYTHLVDDIDGKTAQTETIGSYTITYYLADDGHKIVLADQETTASNIYSESSVAWYYILDTANTRFKLPRSKHNKYTTSLGVKGNGKTLGLTDGTNNAGLRASSSYSLSGITSGYDGTIGSIPTGGNDIGNVSNTKLFGITTDSTKSGIITDDISQDTDQYKYLYFYVGQFTQTATEQTAGLNSELFNDKLDRDFSNKPSNIQYVVETYDDGNGNGYRVWSNKWCEQYGVRSGTAGWYTITFLKPFRDSDYILTGSVVDIDNNGNIQSFGTYNKTSVGVQVANSLGSVFYSTQVSWKAEGFID